MGSTQAGTLVRDTSLRGSSQMSTATKAGNELALAIAKDGFETHRQMPFGCGVAGYVGPLDGSLVMFDNCRLWDDARELQLVELRKILDARGISEVGFASFPPTGPQAGHTVAVVFDCGEEHKAFIRDTWKTICEKTQAARVRPRWMPAKARKQSSGMEDLAARLMAGRSGT